MRIKEIKVSPIFEGHYKKLPNRIKNKAKEKEKIFRENKGMVKKRMCTFFSLFENLTFFLKKNIIKLYEKK